MFSNSNAFLGGNSQRPGPQQFGGSFNTMGSGGQQQQQQPPPHHPQQQAGPFAPQPTGFAPQPMQQQYTGFPMQSQPTGIPPSQPPLQQQYTGFPGAASQQSFSSGPVPPMPPMPSQFQQQFHQQHQQQPQQPQQAQQTQPHTAFQSSQPTGLPLSSPAHLSSPAPPPPPMKPQATGFTEMAASFHTGATPQPQGRRSETNKIPNMRLSFITAQDQSKFETLFKSAVGENSTTMSGEKARDLLLRSRLDGDALSHIWTLADTTRAGQLYFPEFALAMYLCNLKLKGKTLPAMLPDNIKNEVSSMVDMIGFSVADDGPASATNPNAPSFRNVNTASTTTPQLQPTSSQLLQSQMTGFPGPQTGYGSQAPGLQAQQTAFPGMQNPQPTGFQAPLPSMPPMRTGFGQGLSDASMAAPLNAQPTGHPGQWGLVNAPASGLPNIDALQARMMPQQGREAGSYTTQGLQGNAVIPWAITKEEKIRYDALFRAWDGLGKGHIGGDQAIEIFGQSGLEKPDLERVWTLSDNGNKGRLDLDEFAVAMHLIYRKLNGYPLPNRLPPELVPPSTRNFSQSIGTLKSMLNEESDFRKTSGASLLPQKTGVSYMKNRSFRGGVSSPGSRKDATVFRNDDEDFGYRSSARRRLGNQSPRSESPAPSGSNGDVTLDQLRKKIKERQVLLDAMDFADERNNEEDDILDRRDRKESEELYRRIRRIQNDIDAHPDAALATGDSDAERRALKRQLQKLTDKVPDLASQVRRTEKSIQEARLELFRIKDAKAHPHSGPNIVGTGPGGTVTESDRLKARAKAMMQQRTAALTGKKIDVGTEDTDAPRRLEEETMKGKADKERNESLVRDVEDSVRHFTRGIEDNLKEGATDNSSEHERRRWEDGLGVEDEVRDFIFDMQRESRASRVRAQDQASSRPIAPSNVPSLAERSASPRHESPVSKSPAPAAQAPGGSYSSYQTPEERAAYIKQQAEQRMAERLAALGIKAPGKSGETAAQRAERERTERAAKLKQVEEEDARRDAERQARLAEEQGGPPPAPAAETSKTEERAPPPPPTRKVGKPDPSELDAAKKAEQEQAARVAEEARLTEEREEQHREVQKIEQLAREEKEDFAKEQEEAAARLKALEEQVKQGKLRKEEEKKRKKAALAEAKEKEAKLAARRAEMEAAKQRELELQRQLEALDDDSSSEDDDGPQQVTPQESSPSGSQIVNQEPEKEASLPPPVLPVVTSPPTETESKNPYHKMMTQSTEATSPPLARDAGPAPTIAPAAPPAVARSGPSTNPFHRMTQAPPAPSGSVSRKRADSEDWGSDKDSDDDSDEERPGGGNAAQLASILFGTMAPPRPLSAAGKDSTPASPAPANGAAIAPPPPPPIPSSDPAAAASSPPVPGTDAPAASAPPHESNGPSSPPPPPPLPGFDAPSAPPPPPPPPPPPMAPAGAAPPPPPMPSMGAPPPPPPPPPGVAPATPASGGGRPAGFLSEIQVGKSLKKTQTNDKSASAVAGRVLD